MTTEERLERIENGWLDIQQALKLTIAIGTRTNETIAAMARSIAHYADATDARMRRLEENLDGLIRATTAEHSNGKRHSVKTTPTEKALRALLKDAKAINKRLQTLEKRATRRMPAKARHAGRLSRKP